MRIHILRTKSLKLFLFTSAIAAGTLAAQQPPPKIAGKKELFTVISELGRDPASAMRWAGPKGSTLGENLSRFDAFLAARKADIRAGSHEPWKSWLSDLSASEKPTLKVWALTRLVEAGSYTKFNDLLDAMVKHVRGTTQSGSGLTGAAVDQTLPGSFGSSAPTFLINEASPFWPALDRRIREDPQRGVDGDLYTLWCYNTRPSQRELIEEIARNITTPITVKNPHPDPWNDPRFWIVMDWAIAWGEPSDFDRLGQLIPNGPAQAEFQKRTHALLSNPVFFSCKPPSTLDDRKPDADADSSPAFPFGLDIPGLVDFKFMRVKYQPPVLPYPIEAKARRVMGTNTVLIKIDSAGIPCQARPLPGPWLAFLAPASLDFAKDWRFNPTMVSGTPVDSRFLLHIVYRLR